MDLLRRYAGICVACACFAVYAYSVQPLYTRPRQSVAVEMQVAVPRFVQVIMAAGDRYLAANLAGFRTLVASTANMGPDNYRIQALVQTDAAWFNPAHEDNYYLAAALLPWNGQLDAAQTILGAATRARPFDWLPPFYYGFNLLHFLKRPAEGAEWVRLAAEHADDEMQTLQLQQMAANWVAKGEDLGLAIRLLRAMARQTKHKPFAAFLEKRAIRLENLLVLEQAVETYRQRMGVPPRMAQQLLSEGVIVRLPQDPFGGRYGLDANGRPNVVSESIARGRQ